jgi:hypothetical protein
VSASGLHVEYCGERYDLVAGTPFDIGREADLTVDDNPYLHRTFLRIYEDFGMWWLANVGTLLSATVTDGTGLVQAWLSPGARLPIVFEELHVMFSAGATTYDLTVHSDGDYYNTSVALAPTGDTTTRMPITLTRSQRQLVVALAEHVLKQDVPGRGSIPSNADAAGRLGWPITTFNRKLDNVCEKLDRFGVQGLRGGRGKLASDRRLRLVEYAVASRLVDVADLPLLDAGAPRAGDDGDADPPSS